MPLLCLRVVGEVLKLTIAAAHKFDVVGKPWVAYGPSTDGNGCVAVTECFLHVLLQEQVEQDG